MRLIETSNDGQRTEKTLVNEDEYDAILRETFGSVRPAPA
jgi:hypothetical protein